MTASCKQSWCSGLVAVMSVLSLALSILAILAVNVSKRLEKVESRSDTIVELSVDVKYMKASVVKIERLLEPKNGG